MSKSPQDVAVERDIEQDCPSLSADQAFELAVEQYYAYKGGHHGKGRRFQPSGQR